MPRRSRADLATIPVGDLPRQPPPPGMAKDEADEWNYVIQNLPPHWIPPPAFTHLEIYCSAVVNMRACRAVMLAAPQGSPRYETAASLYRREAALVVRLGKWLRLGPRHDRTALRSVPTVAPIAPSTFSGWDWKDPKGDGKPDGAA
jgi:hypothetical protein